MPDVAVNTPAPSPSPSIRRTLLRQVAGALGASSALVFALLFAIGFTERRAAFEQALQDDLRTIANICQVFPDGDTYVNVEPESQGEYMAGGRRFFQVWDARTGELLDRSESLVSRGQTMPRPASVGTTPARFDATLADGQAVSFVTLRADANWGLDAETLARLHLHIDDQPVELLVGRARGEIAASIAPLAIACLGGALLLPALAVLILARAVPRVLAPLDALGDELSARGPDDLAPLRPSSDAPAPTPATPEELAPVIDKLDELMARIAAARQRERGFIANASHELRTPLAELRALIDLAELEAQDADPGNAAHATLAELRAVAQRMGELLDAFLRLAREQRRAGDAPLEDLDLAALIRHAVEAQRDAAAQRGLRFALTDAPRRPPLRASPALARALLDNLVANAIAHARAGSVVEVAVDAQGLSVVNDCGGAEDGVTGPGGAPPPPSAAAPHLGHGLVVAQLYAQAMGVTLQVRREAGRHEARVTA